MKRFSRSPGNPRRKWHEHRLAPRAATPRASFVSTGQIARRVLLKFIRSPQLVVVGTLQGAMFLLIFRYVFGGAIALAGINYVDFVVPGFITTGVLFNAMYASPGWPRT